MSAPCSCKRALLHDSPVYIFDEATSNIDVESENDIMKQIYELAETKTVILISHRLANVAGADNIYVPEGNDHGTWGSQNVAFTERNLYKALECPAETGMLYERGNLG